MKLLPFKSSSLATLGIELELQIINPGNFGLISRAKDLLRNIKQSPYQKHITHEITQSMIEINTSIHYSPNTLLPELIELRNFLLEQGAALNITFSGGGTHPFQKWSVQKIFPTRRYKKLSKQFTYLSKRSTVFGQHVHVGCPGAEDAIYLTHALARYVPQLIAMSGSSPFYQGVDTGYHSSRSTIFNAFPLSGVMPYFTRWSEFSAYFYKMRDLKIIESMKDVYWDIRPKPEFGTVEVRVCDMPLNLEKTVIIAAYIQTLAYYLLQEKPFTFSKDLYYLYNYNRFQASRYGFEGIFVHSDNGERCSVGEDILETVKKLEHVSHHLNTHHLLKKITTAVNNHEDDATTLREIYKKVHNLPGVVAEQVKLWASD